MKDSVDPRLIQQIDQARDDDELEAVVMVSQAEVGSGDVDERGVGGRVIDHAVERVQQQPSEVRFLPKLGVVYVKGSSRLIRQLLDEDDVVSATANDAAFTLDP